MNFLKQFSLMLLLAWLPPCMAGDISEDKIKSAYVLNFAKFVEWPANMQWPDGKLNLCVVGSDVLDGALMELSGRKVGGRELHVIQHINAGDDLSVCHLVFIGESEHGRAASIIKALGDIPALSLSDTEDFAEKGGGIGLLHRESKIVFEVNLAATNKAGLHFPSQFLNLAFHVFGK